jgi:hypothetical protein
MPVTDMGCMPDAYSSCGAYWDGAVLPNADAREPSKPYATSSTPTAITVRTPARYFVISSLPAPVGRVAT